MSDAPVIRIVKKKHAHAAHHGGSWKVAYADFVTAMMAFFMVMWLLSLNQEVRQEIQDYFNNPASAAQSRAGISKLASGGSNPLASGTLGMGAKSWRELALEAQKERFSRVRDTLKNEIAGRPDLSHFRSEPAGERHAGHGSEELERAGPGSAERAVQPGARHPEERDRRPARPLPFPI